MADTYLGIDLGTTSVKAALFDGDGTCLGRATYAHTTQRRAPGWAAQDPGHWLSLIDAALAELGTEAQAPLAAAALTSQVNTHVFVDVHGTPLMPAILWQDTRAAAEADELNARLSDADKIAWLGAPIPIDASHVLARMLWVQRHHPEIWAETAQVLLPKDFALRHLTGRAVSDPLSNIGVVGLDGTYVAPILDLVPGASDRMAPLAGLTEIVGAATHPALRGTPVCTATMDGWVGLVGAGATKDGAGVYLSGTSEILGLASPTVTNAPGIVVFAEACGLRLHAGPTQSGGASQAWIAELVGKPLRELSDCVSGHTRGPSTPLFLPHLAGERAPLWNADLRGAFLGLGAATTQADLVLSVYEGVALSARHVLGALEASGACQPETLLCGGGGFRADAWGQIRADVLGRPLRRLAMNEPGVVGAACLAAMASGAAGSLAEAHAGFCHFDTVWHPRPAETARYDHLFDLYLEAIDANARLGKAISAQGAPDPT